LPVTGTKMAGMWRARGLSRRAYAVLWIRKDWVVMSQCAHITTTWECPEAAPAWLVARAAKPVNGRSWSKVPLLCVEAFSLKCVLFKMETRIATEHGWPDLVRVGEFQTHG
jgi:hypothetical protein